MMRKHFSSISSRFAPVLLLLVSVLAFGLLIPGLGFYWDDWAKILVARLYGLAAYPAYYASDRPLSAWTHMLFTPLLGQSPLAWQVFNLLLRWLSAVGMLWSLNLLWPRARRQNLAAALLFLVYPVFIQQPAGVTFHQQWLQYALFFLSLGAMLRAKKFFSPWTLLSLGASLLQLSITEYFVSLELVRPFVLWFAMRDAPARGLPKSKAVIQKALRVLRAWAPYLALLSGYTVYRLFLMRLPGKDPYRAETLYNFLSNPLKTLQDTLLVALIDELHILVDSWAGLLRFQVLDAAPFTLFSYAVGLAAGGLVAAALMGLVFHQENPANDLPAEQDDPPGWLRQALILGVAGVLVGPIPAWITGRQVVFDFHSNRYAMPAMFGAALLFTVGIEWLAQRRVQRAVLAGVLVALAVGLHLRVANDYRWIWTSQQRFFWQLAWRTPGLTPNTALFLENEPFPDQGLFSTSAALNLMYPQGFGPFSTEGANRLSYWVYTLRPRYQKAPDSFSIGLSTRFRTLRFEGQTPGSLLLFNDPSRANCLWVLSARDQANPYLPELVRDFLPISNLERITPEPAPGYPPQDLIGPEPAHTTWCYYFEKADLARQQGDWPTAARLAEQAKAQGYTPAKSGSNSPYEWLPMVEGLARVGQWSEAARLTRRAYEQDPNFQAMYCDLWAGLGADQTVAETRTFLGCEGSP